MRLRIVCIMLFVSFISLQGVYAEAASPTIKEQYDTGCFLSAPENGVLVVIGVASRRRTESEGRDAALNDAARKAALYHGLAGSEMREHRTGGNFFDFSSASATDIVYDTDYSKYRDALVYDETKDVLFAPDSVFVRCAYPAPAMKAIDYSHAITNKTPDWIRTPPQEIAGLMVGVGFAGKQRHLVETIAKSYDSAIVALLSRVSTTVIVRDTDIAMHKAFSESIQLSEGTLNGFLVLETWIDPKTKSVWTLAVAQGQQ